MCLRGHRARTWGALPFGLFLVVWSVQIAAGNFMRVATDPVVAERLYLVFLVSLLPLPYLLLTFAGDQLGRARGGRAPSVIAAMLAVAAATLFLVQPAWLYEGVDASRTSLQPRWGPLFAPLVLAPFFLAVGIALVTLARARRDAPTPRTAARVTTLLAGLGVYASFTAGSSLGYYAAYLATFPATPLVLAYVALFAILLALVAAALGIAMRANAAARDRDRWLVAALVAPLVWGLAEGALRLQILPRFDTVGLWRLVAAGLVAFALVQWRAPQAAARARRAATVSAGVAGVGAAGAGAWGATALVAPGPLLPLVVGGAIGAALTLPAVRAVRRWLDAPPARSQDSDVAYGERIESYRAALETSIARGTLDEDREFLAALRERFDIGEEAHRVLLHYARSAVIVARDGNVDGAYERLRLLGEGGAGRTWLARDRVRDQLVVLKEPLAQFHEDPLIIEAVTREARLAARVRHPNVVRIHEVVSHEGRPVMVMEYAEGGSLAHALRARGRLPVRDAVSLTVQVLDGLAAVHDAGVVHRDIKPSNVLLTREGVPKIADFGVAVAAASGKTVVLHDSPPTTSRAGTLAYMAPEVLRGASLGDVRSDVYACAVLLHECLTGAPGGSSGTTLFDASVPAAVRDAIARALDPDPSRRPATARAFRDALARTVTH